MTKSEIVALIRREARAANLDPDCMVRIAELESSLNPNAVNRTILASGKASNAAGLYQIMPFHKVADVMNPVVNARWAMNYAKQNHEHLRKNGLPVNCFTTYLAHQQGADGAVILLKAAREGKKIKDLSDKIRTNVGANDAKQDFTTVEQFLRFWERKVNKTPISMLPEPVQIPLARFSASGLAAASLTALAAGAVYAVTRLVEKTTLKEAWKA